MSKQITGKQGAPYNLKLAHHFQTAVTTRAARSPWPLAGNGGRSRSRDLRTESRQDQPLSMLESLKVHPGKHPSPQGDWSLLSGDELEFLGVPQSHLWLASLHVRLAQCKSMLNNGRIYCGCLYSYKDRDF